MTGRERTTVAVAIDVQDHGTVDASGPQEVAVEGVRQSLLRHGCSRGTKGLRGDLAAVERNASARALLVLAPEEVAVEDFEVE